MKKQLNKKLIIGIAVGVVALIAIIVAVVTYKPTVSVNEYVTVEYTGYNGYGTAEVYFDTEKFCEDYKGKIKKLEGSESSGEELLAKNLCRYLEKSLSKNTKLSNGEEIKYQWQGDISAYENAMNCKIKYSDMTFTVEGLQELEKVDIFEDVQVTYEGIAPFGKAIITNNSNVFPYLQFSADRSNLSNGDTIKVSIQLEDEYSAGVESIIELHGVLPEAIEKEYVVEGLPEYITTISQLSDDVLGSLKQQAEAVHSQHVAEEWSNGEFGNSAKVTGFEYVGAYVLSSTETNMYTPSLNRVLMVYKVNAHAESKFETLSLSGDTTYYTCIIFDDVYIANDGALVISKVSVPERTNHKLELNHDTNTWYSRTFFFYGYSTLEDLYKNEVDSKSSMYTYETNIKGE